MKDCIAIPHSGSKPPWLEDDVRICIDFAVPACDASKHLWHSDICYYLPADHWAYPVLRLRASTGENWTPWNAKLQGDVGPPSWRGGMVMTLNMDGNPVVSGWGSWPKHCSPIGFISPQPREESEPSGGLVERLHAIDRSHLGDGHYCNWHRNPDGPEAAARIQALEQQVATLTAERDAAIAEMTKCAQEAGEAKGRLEASEWPGVVDGWREKCEALERERDAAIAREGKAWRERNIAYAKVKGWESVVYVEGLPLRAVQAADWGPGEGEQTTIPAITPRKLTELLDEVARLRTALADAPGKGEGE